MFSALIIDADEAANASIRSALAPFGFEFTATQDASEAMSLAKTATPDIIFLRVELPNVSGFSVCNKLRRNDDTRYIPLVMYASDVSRLAPGGRIRLTCAVPSLNGGRNSVPRVAKTATEAIPAGILGAFIDHRDETFPRCAD